MMADVWKNRVQFSLASLSSCTVLSTINWNGLMSETNLWQTLLLLQKTKVSSPSVLLLPFYHTVPNLRFLSNTNFMMNLILIFWTQFVNRFWIWNVKKIKEFKFLPQKWVKINYFSMFWKFNYGSKTRFLARKFKYLILSRISSNFGVKIQTWRKAKFH